MPKEKTLEEAYKECETNGLFKDQETINKDKIQSMMQISDTSLQVAGDTKKNLDPKSMKWNVVYTLHYVALRCITLHYVALRCITLHYVALHQLADILVRFDHKKIPNHQCLFAYICTHHKELELDWNFFEKIRTKRNGIQYYGSPATHQDFKEIEIQINLYIQTLKKAIEEKSKEFWGKVLNGEEIFSEEEAEDIERITKKSRKEYGFRR